MRHHTISYMSEPLGWLFHVYEINTNETVQTISISQHKNLSCAVKAAQAHTSKVELQLSGLDGEAVCKL